MPGMRRVGLASCVAALLLTACADSTSAIDPARYGTWLWNGSSWSQLAHAGGSEATPAPAYPNGETLRYWTDLGGLVDADGTRWDGTAWAANVIAYPSIPTGAGSGQQTAWVLDEARDQLLFLDPNSQTLWAWSHGTWKALTTPDQWPKARYLRGAAYDPARQEVLILMCCNVSSPSPAPEAWAWTGKTFVQRPALPEDGYELVPDGRGHMLAFGTQAAFSWDGTSWTSLAAGAALRIRQGSVVRDGAHDQIVAIGQDNAGSVSRWQDGRWQAVATASSPPGGCDVSNPVFDPELSGIVITDLPADCAVSVLP